VGGGEKPSPWRKKKDHYEGAEVEGRDERVGTSETMTGNSGGKQTGLGPVRVFGYWRERDGS